MRRRRGNVFSKHRIGVWGYLGIFLALLAIGCGIYTVYDNGRIVINRQDILIHNLSEGLEGFTILHISDLNGKRFGARQKKIADALKGAQYDAVVMTGDMVGKGGDMYPFHELLSALDMTKPVFFIAGDSDPSPVSRQPGSATTLSDWITGAQARGAVFLDVPARLRVGNANIWFTDASQLSLDLEMAEAAYAASGKTETDYYADVVSRTKAEREKMGEQDLHVTLSHNPLKRDNVLGMYASIDGTNDSFVRTVDLALSGGAVGGQWRLPWIGPVWADGFFPDDAQVRGFRKTGTLIQYISGGLSTSDTAPLPAFRLFNTPEISLIRLTAVMGENVLPN